MFLKTFKEAPREADSISHALLVRGSFIYQCGSGLYSFLPMGNRVLKKIVKIVEEEMDNIGGQMTTMPSLASKTLWDESKRWDVYGKELMRLEDRKGRLYALSPTAEESFVDIVRKSLKSYKDLPHLLYQITPKYRDEKRPRFGLMRSREFIMKDGYSFHTTEGSLSDTFNEIREAYIKIFERMELNFKVCDADSGAIGGNNSQEFIVMTDAGEAEVVYCEKCGYSSNVEKAEGGFAGSRAEDLKETDKVLTKGVTTIEELSKSLSVDKEKCLKVLAYGDGKKNILVVLRGDHELNEMKLASLLKSSNFNKLSDKEIEDMGLIKGYIGPQDHTLKIIADSAALEGNNMVAGSNALDYHTKNVNYLRDWKADLVGDIRTVGDGDLCKCGAILKGLKGIEVGHIFKIGQKYSKAMGSNYVDENGKNQPMEMGCYGIGISRVLAAIVEQNNDVKGIVWPWSIAPFHISIIVANIRDERQMEVGNEIYSFLKSKGYEVLLDDRDFRIGFKRKDAELIGIPIHIIVGDNVNSGEVDLFDREKSLGELVKISDLAQRVEAMAEELNSIENN